MIHTTYSSRSCVLDTNILAEISVGRSKSFVPRIDYATVVFFSRYEMRAVAHTTKRFSNLLLCLPLFWVKKKNVVCSDSPGNWRLTFGALVSGE